MEIDTLKIKILLAERRMTQADLAKKCGIARQNICCVLAKGRCSPITAGKIATGLDVRVSEILKGGSDRAI